MTLEGRDYYIDRIRVALTVLVILHHSAITYGASGGWFYREIPVSAATSSVILTIICTINQAFFMGFFFFLAGYYTPSSLDHKGGRKFLSDRLVRLGIPLVVFIFVLGPVTIWLARLRDSAKLLSIIGYLWEQKQFVSGPLWFAQALLIFSFAYLCWRVIRKESTLPEATNAQVPSDRIWILSAIAVGGVALLVRQFVPVGKNVLGLQLAYFPSYIFLFIVGILSRRRNWLSQLNGFQARRWGLTSLIALPFVPIAIALSRAQVISIGNFVGGFTLSSILYAFWEPFVAWGVIALTLACFGKNGNTFSKKWTWLARRAYLVYIIHPLVLVSISVALEPWQAAVLLKFVVTGSLSCFLSWIVAEPLLRIPGLIKIV